MIYRLQKRMIWICCSAVLLVFVLIFAAICIIGARQLDSTMDMMTDRISDGNGSFRPMAPGMDRDPGLFTEETPFSTRFFTVWLASDGTVTGVNLDAVSSVSQDEAQEYAQKVLTVGKERGWQGNFRYKVYSNGRSIGIVFVDGSTNRFMTQTQFAVCGAVLVVSMVVIVILIILLSKPTVRPIAQSYEKQKQFVTDAGHELKTPLTLILTNLDIVRAELGDSEWLDDMRTESQRMSELVGQLTALSRMDEDEHPMVLQELCLSELCTDVTSEFDPLVATKGLTLSTYIVPDISIRGDEGALRQLLGILLDNAVKYCDLGGNIYLSLTSKWQPVLVVENACAGVEELELDRLFDRFYRADKARTAGSGFGIGLSLAHSIVQKHHADIKAYKAGPGRIGFRVTLK